MLVVRELNGELAFVSGFVDLICLVRPAKCKSLILARRRPDVTNGADGGAGAGHRLPAKELRAMTLHAGVVSGKVRHVRKISLRIPFRRNFVTGIAGKRFVFLG
jgi:hypothetical protein